MRRQGSLAKAFPTNFEYRFEVGDRKNASNIEDLLRGHLYRFCVIVLSPNQEDVLRNISWKLRNVVRKAWPVTIRARYARHASHNFMSSLPSLPKPASCSVSLTTNFCRRWHDEQSPPWVLLMLFFTHSFMFRFKTLVCSIPCRPYPSTAREVFRACILH